MIGQALAPFRDVWERLANNPDFARSVATSYGGIALNVLIQIALVPLYLAYLGRYQFGVLMIVLGAINYLSVGITWATSGAQRILGEMTAVEDRQGLDQAYGMARLVFVGYAVSVAAFTLGGTWMVRDSLEFGAGLDFPTLFKSIALAGAYLIVLFDFNVDRIALVASGRQATANAFAIVSQAVFAISVIPLLRDYQGLPGVMAALLVGASVARMAAWWCTWRLGFRWRLPGRRGLQIFRRLVGPMGGGYALYGILVLTLLQADVLILGWLGGAKMVADFVLIWKIADVGIQALWRIPESLQPYLIQMDVRKEFDRLQRIFRQGQKWMTAIAAVVAVGYAALGPSVVRLWVGAENAPDAPWAYVLAGGGVFWLVSARTPAVFAFSMLRLSGLNRAAGVEVVAKLVVLVALFPIAGYYSPIIAVNLVHLGGAALLYRRLAPRKREESGSRSSG